MQSLIFHISVSGLLVIISLISTIYGIRKIPNDYGIWGNGCKDIKGAFIYNFFGMGGMFVLVFSSIYFIAMILRLITYLITHCEYMLI